MASKQFRVSGTDLDFLEKLSRESGMSVTEVANMAMTIGVAHVRQAFFKRLKANKERVADEYADHS
ncbi:TPA: hypothetical protein N2817_002552 [Vibrio parahaemolyticus]|nr:hypothetical protein [Vibrio parahaemolyticus]